MRIFIWTRGASLKILDSMPVFCMNRENLKNHQKKKNFQMTFNESRKTKMSSRMFSSRNR